MSQKPAHETTMNAAARDNRASCDIRTAGGNTASAPAARLQAIHDLIRSGDYHVPASLIADRMIERMLAEKRGPRR